MDSRLPERGVQRALGGHPPGLVVGAGECHERVLQELRRGRPIGGVPREEAGQEFLGLRGQPERHLQHVRVADPVEGGAADRIKSLAFPASGFPDWDCEEGWIDVLGEQQQSEAQVARGAPSKVSGVAAVPAGGMAVGGGGCSDELETEEDVPFGGDAPAADASVGRQSKRCPGSDCRVGALPLQLVLCCNGVTDDGIKLWFPTKSDVLLCLIPLVHTLLTPNFPVCPRDRPRSVPHTTLARATVEIICHRHSNPGVRFRIKYLSVIPRH